MRSTRFGVPVIFSLLLLTLFVLAPAAPAAELAPGFISLFNGKDLTGWKVPAGDGGHWKVVDGVIDYDAESQAPRRQEPVDGRRVRGLRPAPGVAHQGDALHEPERPDHPLRRHAQEGAGREGDQALGARTPTPAIFLRGSSKSQVNIWCWPTGSGEVYGYRMDEKMPTAVRAGVTPKANADKDVGEWNAFEITMKGDRLTVVLNGITVLENAQLPGVPARGPIALQHHGQKKDGVWTGPPSLVQFRNVSIKELK